jgi:hypothetical protein
MVNIDVLYYSRNELVNNASIYYPNQKQNNNPLDISYLEQVKSNIYTQDGVKDGVFLALNNFRADDLDGVNNGNITLKTSKGIISFIDSYDVGNSVQPYIPKIITFSKAIFVSGLYAQNGLDVYIKIIRFDDQNLTRKIEIFY